MRYPWCSLVFVLTLGLFFTSCGGSAEEETIRYQVNFVASEDYVWKSHPQEVEEWATLLSESLALLPEDMQDIMTANGEKKLNFHIYPYTNEDGEDIAGQAGGGVGGDIAFYAPVFEKMSRAEKTLTIIHELGHIYHDANPDFDVPSFLEVVLDKERRFVEAPPVIHAFRSMGWKGEIEPTENGANVDFTNRTLLLGKYDPREDYGHSFALFVLWGEKLKECCPIRYEFFQGAFGEEYPTFQGITESKLFKGTLIQEILNQGINIEVIP